MSKTKSDDEAPILECLRCLDRYSKADVRSGLYRLETIVCSRCYARMQRAPHRVSCFGKPTMRTPDWKTLLGYNPSAPECRDLCPDRVVCRRVVRAPV